MAEHRPLATSATRRLEKRARAFAVKTGANVCIVEYDRGDDRAVGVFTERWTESDECTAFDGVILATSGPDWTDWEQTNGRL